MGGRGRWTYLYRAIDSNGDTVEFWFSERRKSMSWLGTLDELYGAVGAMIGFMLWVWLSVTVVLIGAEFDASGMEVEKDGGFSH